MVFLGRLVRILSFLVPINPLSMMMKCKHFFWHLLFFNPMVL